jgi:hypothetical protein
MTFYRATSIRALPRGTVLPASITRIARYCAKAHRAVDIPPLAGLFRLARDRVEETPSVNLERYFICL